MPGKIRFDVSEFKALAKRYKKSVPLIQGAVKGLLVEATLATEAEVKVRMPVHTGAAAGSVKHKFVGVGTKSKMMVGLVFSSKPYMAVIEEGRGSGKTAPPVRVIESWIRKKTRKAGAGEKFGMARRKVDLSRIKGRTKAKRIKAAAYIISRSIGKKGIPAKHPFDKGWKAARPKIKVARKKTLMKLRHILSKGA